MGRYGSSPAESAGRNLWAADGPVARLMWMHQMAIRRPIRYEFAERGWGVSRRTFQRDLERLRRIGYRLEEAERGQGYAIRGMLRGPLSPPPQAKNERAKRPWSRWTPAPDGAKPGRCEYARERDGMTCSRVAQNKGRHHAKSTYAESA